MTNRVTFAALALAASLGACAAQPTPTQQLLQQTQNACLGGNKAACDQVPYLLTQEYEERQERRQNAALALGWMASHTAPQPTFASLPPPQQPIHCSSVGMGNFVNTTCQ